ncbi:MAG: hypothetical protein ABIJ26_08465 [Candidatus Margulisiibacteriota bacterium]
MKHPTLKFQESMEDPGTYNLLWPEKDLLFDAWALGMGWAERLPGWIVFLGKEARYPPVENYYHVLLEERASTNIDLLDKAVALVSRHQIRSVFARMDRAMSDFLARYNAQARGGRRKQISVRQAPHADNSGDMTYFVSLLQERLRRTSPTLFIPQNSPLVSELVNVSAKTTVRDFDHPGLGALAYALAGLEAFGDASMSIRDGGRTDRERNTWDPLHRNGR